MSPHTKGRISLDPHSGVPVHEIATLADLDAAIIGADCAGAHHRAYLMRQFKAGRIALVDVQRSTSARYFKRFAGQCRRPALVVVGADDGLGDGPEAWRLAGRMLRWAKAVIIHGAGGAIREYELAVVVAQRHRRALLIECEGAALPAWEALARAAVHLDFVLLIPPLDGVHPLPSSRAVAH